MVCNCKVVDEEFAYDNAELTITILVAHRRGAIENFVKEQEWQTRLKLAKTGEQQ